MDSSVSTKRQNLVSARVPSRFKGAPTVSPKKKHLVSVNMRGTFARGMVTILGYGIQTSSARALRYICDDLHTFSC